MTSDEVWQKAIKSIMTGSGSPLLMNERPIMENMIKFGYHKEDVWNVGTSACWEPLVIGKSFDQNNPFLSIVAIRPLNDLIINNVEFESFDDLYNAYKELYSEEIKRRISDIEFDCSPLFSLFFDDCISRGKDFTQGGAVYAYHGAQVVSFPNTINALLNIKRLVYDEKMYALEDLRKAIMTNFEGQKDLQILLSNTGKKFGLTDEDVLNLTNDLMQYTGSIVASVTCNGQPVKVGFSSPNYIYASRDVQASLDGRRDGYPFAVHISPISSKIDISEVLDFASKLDYQGNLINGNVVDFILPTSYVRNGDKLIGILRDACSKGVFELQLNVLDKTTLLDAKAHPDKYPNLIVRVWGFSAYFNDLPDDFKDNLIQRAETYEVA
jgi:formate C-acetyltransferase